MAAQPKLNLRDGVSDQVSEQVRQDKLEAHEL